MAKTPAGFVCTEVETKAAKKYSKHYGQTIVITNDFVRMMNSALLDALKVLNKRKRDLAKWGEKEKDDFKDIMGVDGDAYIDDVFYICDMKNKNTYSPSEVETITVVEFMRKAVDRMYNIMSQLHVDANPVEVSLPDPCIPELAPVPDKKVYKYGNFVNRTFTSQYSAFVERTATWTCSPEQYKDGLEIHIGYNFCKKNPMGADSRASTLCHEVSHFYRVEPKGATWASEEDKIKSRGPWGGVGTDDLPNDQDYKQSKGSSGGNIYIEYREKLKKNHDLGVFKNAYNFELYFELTEKECLIEVE